MPVYYKLICFRQTLIYFKPSAIILIPAVSNELPYKLRSFRELTFVTKSDIEGQDLLVRQFLLISNEMSVWPLVAPCRIRETPSSPILLLARLRITRYLFTLRISARDFAP